MLALHNTPTRPQVLQQQLRPTKHASSRASPSSIAHRGNAIATCTLNTNQEGPELSRRAIMSLTTCLTATCVTATSAVQPAMAVGFQKELKKRKVALDEYTALPPFDWKGSSHDGLKIFDLVVGTGALVEKGTSITVHYDCKFRGLVAVSSREARLLGGNRTIAEPFQFNYGKVPLEYTREVRKDTFTGVGIKVSKDPDNGYYLVDALTKGAPAFSSGIERNDKLIAINGTEIRDRPISEVGKLLLGEAGTEVTLTVIPYGQEDLTSPKSYTLRRETYSVKAKVQAPIMTEGGGGLYSGPSGPKPPAALYLALDGMRVGGKRSIVVGSDLGYGEDGSNEIPPNADLFIMDVEVLEVKPRA